MFRLDRHLFAFILIFLSACISHYANAESFLLFPSVRSISELRTAERIGRILQSNPRNKVVALLHSIDYQSWQEKSVSTLSFGNADELQSAWKNDSSQANQDKFVIAQIEKQDLIKRLEKEKFDTIVCNAEDAVCRYISHYVDFSKKIFLITTCPKNWEQVFGAFPTTSKGSLVKVKEVLLNIFSKIFPSKTASIPVEYQQDALYLSECFPPVYNPEPNLDNVFPIGSLLGESPKNQLPDHFQKPILIANKIVLVNVGADEAANKAILLDTFKSFPTYLFIVVSDTFDIEDYALGNVIVDENVPLNEILTHNKMTMLISNGKWTPLLNAVYHGVPVITLGKSEEGVIGRQLVADKNIGVDLSQKKYNSEMLQESIREVVFNGVYKTNIKIISNYLKGLNTHYLLPPMINDFMTAKERAKTDL